jgi:hypothetical protein
VFHTALILFNLTGWMWRKTRRLHLGVLLLTVLSWTVLGIWYGFGYCPSTHWHWLVRLELGYRDMPASYIKFLLDSLTGLEADPALVDTFAVVFLVAALVLSVVANLRDRRARRRSARY